MNNNLMPHKHKYCIIYPMFAKFQLTEIKMYPKCKSAQVKSETEKGQILKKINYCNGREPQFSVIFLSKRAKISSFLGISVHTRFEMEWFTHRVRTRLLWFQVLLLWNLEMLLEIT